MAYYSGTGATYKTENPSTELLWLARGTVVFQPTKSGSIGTFTNRLALTDAETVEYFYVSVAGAQYTLTMRTKGGPTPPFFEETFGDSTSPVSLTVVWEFDWNKTTLHFDYSITVSGAGIVTPLTYTGTVPTLTGSAGANQYWEYSILDNGL